MSTPPPLPTTEKKKATFEIGQTLGHANQFKIVKRIGQGGCGEVFLAFEERAKRHRAIKTLLPEHNANKKMLRRFKAEYTLGNLLSHPGLVQMFDLYESPEGIHYLVMEYIDGEALSARMHRMEQTAGQLGVDEALQVGWQIASLFDQLHERRIIHRDLKPGNILVLKDPTIHGGVRYKLIDFGIAKVVDKSQAQSLEVDNETTTGSILGTVQLMSPETISRTKEQGPAADVYSLGCMLYRAIAGNYPFNSGNDMETLMGHMTQEPIPLTSEAPLMPHDVADMIHRMIAKDPAERPTMREISEFFARKLKLAANAAGQVVVKGGTQELQAVLGDASTGPATPTASGSLVMEVSEAPSGQRGQLVAALTQVSRRRQRAMVGSTLAVVAVLVTGAAVLRSVSKPAGRQAAAVAVAPVPAAVIPSAAVADLGVSPGSATNAPAVAASAKPATLAPAPEKKHKKKKGKIIVDE